MDPLNLSIGLTKTAKDKIKSNKTDKINERMSRYGHFYGGGEENDIFFNSVNKKLFSRKN